jgi:acid phosphatase
MQHTRRSFVQTLFRASQVGLLSRLSLTQARADAATNRLNFLVLGDWGRKGRPDQQQVADQMGKTGSTLRPSFVISVGDNFYEAGVASLTDEHWAKSFENVYAAPSLQVPWFVTLGNHDYVGNTEAQLEYGKQSKRWNMPSRYYAKSFPVGEVKVDFFFLDTCPAIEAYRQPADTHHPDLTKHVLEQDFAPQLAWLDDSLAKSTAAWKLVVGHHPIYSGGIHGDQPELIAKLLPLLQKYKVPAYFCGHDHDMQHLKADTVELFVSGGGSEHRPNLHTSHTEYGESVSGFMAVSLGAESMQVQIIDGTGAVLHQATVPRAA